MQSPTNYQTLLARINAPLRRWPSKHIITMKTARYTKKDRMLDFYRRFADLGFERHETDTLRRAEMTLSRWAEAECNGEIERDETTGRPFRRYGNYVQANDPRSIHYIADREAGALRRLRAIVFARNARARGVDETITGNPFMAQPDKHDVYAYHQGDPRGCALYIVPASVLPDVTDDDIIRHSGPSAVKSAESRLQWALSCYYTRGLACNY